MGTNQVRCERHYEQRYEQWAAPLRGRPGVVRALNIVNRGIVVVFYAAYALLARVGLRERSVEAGSPRRRHRRGVRRSEFLPEAVQCAAALRVLRHRAAHCSRWRRASRSRAVMPSLPSPSRQVGLRPARPLPSCCWLRLSCLRSAASSAACTFRVMSSSVPSLAPPRVRLLLFWRRCSKEARNLRGFGLLCVMCWEGEGFSQLRESQGIERCLRRTFPPRPRRRSCRTR